LAGRLAAQKMDKKFIPKMAKCLEEQLKTVREGNLFRYSQLDFDFHSILYKMSRNTFLQEMLDSIKIKMQPLNIELKPILTQLYQDHVEIFEALRSENPDRVEKALIQHYEKILDHIKKGVKMEAERVRISKELSDNHNHLWNQRG
jgi:DNA-binding GntR family transcriptional regulator